MKNLFTLLTCLVYLSSFSQGPEIIKSPLSDKIAYKTYKDSTGDYKIKYEYDPLVYMVPLTNPPGQSHYYATITVYKIHKETVLVRKSKFKTKIEFKLEPTNIEEQIGESFQGYYTVNGCFEDTPEDIINQAYKTYKPNKYKVDKKVLDEMDKNTKSLDSIQTTLINDLSNLDIKNPKPLFIDSGIITTSGKLSIDTAVLGVYDWKGKYTFDTVKAVIEILYDPEIKGEGYLSTYWLYGYIVRQIDKYTNGTKYIQIVDYLNVYKKSIREFICRYYVRDWKKVLEVK